MKRLILVVDAPDDFGTETLGDAATWLEALDSRVSVTAFANAEDAAFDERIKSGAFETPATNLPRLVEVPDLETPRMLVLSTAHIKGSTNHQFQNGTFRDQMPIFYEKGEYGFFIPLTMGTDVIEDRVRWQGYPDLIAIRALAEANGCTWIMLDRDADVVADLPLYEW